MVNLCFINSIHVFNGNTPFDMCCKVKMETYGIVLYKTYR